MKSQNGRSVEEVGRYCGESNSRDITDIKTTRFNNNNDNTLPFEDRERVEGGLFAKTSNILLLQQIDQNLPVRQIHIGNQLIISTNSRMALLIPSNNKNKLKLFSIS